jgi:hypothetical protein
MYVYVRMYFAQRGSLGVGKLALKCLNTSNTMVKRINNWHTASVTMVIGVRMP